MTSNEQQTVALPQKRPERGLIARGECSKGRRGIRVKGQEADRAIWRLDSIFFLYLLLLKKNWERERESLKSMIDLKKVRLQHVGRYLETPKDAFFKRLQTTGFPPVDIWSCSAVHFYLQ